MYSSRARCGPWLLIFAPGWLENLSFFMQIICWAPWILQFQSIQALQFSLKHSFGPYKQDYKCNQK